MYQGKVHAYIDINILKKYSPSGIVGSKYNLT